jgi:hypothetical protein
VTATQSRALSIIQGRDGLKSQLLVLAPRRTTGLEPICARSDQYGSEFHTSSIRSGNLMKLVRDTRHLRASTLIELSSNCHLLNLCVQAASISHLMVSLFYRHIHFDFLGQRLKFSLLCFELFPKTKPPNIDPIELLTPRSSPLPLSISCCITSFACS